MYSSSAPSTLNVLSLFIIPPGSLTLHHWQQLAKPHLATILDPHPGVVTKGFCPLPQDAVYRLSDMEEDDQEEEEEQEGVGILEKGASERGKDEEDEEGGITFKVRVSSTPDERRDRKGSPPAPPPPSPPSPSLPAEKFSPSQDQSQAFTTSSSCTTNTTFTSTTSLATTTSSGE